MGDRGVASALPGLISATPPLPPPPPPGLTVADGLDLDGLGDLLLGRGQHRLSAHLGLEQRVHQGGLPQATLT